MIIAEVYCNGYQEFIPSEDETHLHESDYQQLLLDYFEIYGRSSYVMKYAITKEVKITGICG
jgi:hypothetical protein